ncbi:L-threonylcarbamoyladenylate synthase [Francisella frigiditurris]|uniref:L-threonylcarbamoyladenylate synthase n=1 Tax=Francisella frigiditurris TaxID=1542390 RepID=A0A1J0KTG8_9GAMM|nr:Sua5/YciO/YrdC/YwlC family protein [Francisella frigiditurris]APC96932.1 telomere recombination family protein [Francisella frigiditurris]
MLTSKIDEIIKDLKENKIVAIPTDTIYGFSCLINESAIKSILSLKRREPSKGLIIISSNPKHLANFIKLEILSKAQLDKIFSETLEPTTWIVPAKNTETWLTGGKDTIAVRLTNNETIEKITSNLSQAIISTSANLSGNESLSTTSMIDSAFPNIKILETNKTLNTKPSKIIDIIKNIQIR